MQQTKRLVDVHRDALSDFDDIQALQRQQRDAAFADRLFASEPGGQWDGGLEEQYENRARFEFSRVHMAGLRFFSEYRNNRISVSFQSRDGSDDQKLANMCQGLYRADEQASVATEAYDNAFQDGIEGGMGAWRLRCDYEDPDDEDDDRQTVRIEPIYDADQRVWFDNGAMRADKADAKRCYVLTSYARAEAVIEFGEDVTDFDAAALGCKFPWVDNKTVWLCELYKVESKSSLARFFRPSTSEGKEDDQEFDADELDDEKLAELEATGFREVRQRSKRQSIIKKYTLAGSKVINECVIPGSQIPIVPFYAKRWVIGGQEKFMGFVRPAKDAQRLHNMLLSWLADMAARFDIEKPIFSPEQIAGHAQMWADDNHQRYPYLLANQILGADGSPLPGAPVAYTKAPTVPQAMQFLAQLASDALTEMLGRSDESQKMQANLSGKAVELIQQRLDMHTFLYTSNFTKSHARAGAVWLSMKRRLVTEDGRIMKTIDKDGVPSSVIMNRPIVDKKSGEITLENDLSAASFEVVSDAGPSSSSARAAAVRSATGLLQMSQGDPEVASVLTHLVLQNIEGEGMEDVRQWSRQKMIGLGVIKPTDDEAQAMAEAAAGQREDPQAQFLQAESMKSLSAVELNKAKTVEAMESAQLKNAQATKIASESFPQYAQEPHSKTE